MLLVLGALLVSYYVTIPLVGPHFSEVCRKGEYGPPDDCQSWDVVTAAILRTINGLDDHSGLMAALTGAVVAFFTGVLWWATEKLWGEARQQRKDTRKGGLASVIASRAALRSSRAAEKSANTAERALHNLEGPIIRPYRMEYYHNDSIGTISFAFRNYGRSPSVVQGVSAIFIITPANNPATIQHHITVPFMFDEMVAEKETSEILTVRHDLLRQHGDNIDKAITDLHLMINFSWDSVLGPQHGGGTRFIWSPKRRLFLSGIQLWDDPDRFPPGSTRRQ